MFNIFRQFKALVFVPPTKLTEAVDLITNQMEENAQVKISVADPVL
jgi:hypothetical protein